MYRLYQQYIRFVEQKTIIDPSTLFSIQSSFELQI